MMETLSQAGWEIIKPFLSPSSRIFWPGLASFFLISMFWAGPKQLLQSKRYQELLENASFRLDISLFIGNRLLWMLFPLANLLSSWWLSINLFRFWTALLGPALSLQWSSTAIMIVYSVALFLIWDLSRFCLHLLLHKVPFLWAFHQIHHSATVLTPLTFFRTHPVETLLYQIRSVLSTSFVVSIFMWLFVTELQAWELLGVPAVGFILNMIVGNLRHSHVWIRYPAWLESWLISPAQHQLHHANDPQYFDCNFGTWLAIWDRMLGSLHIATEQPEGYGVLNSNHKMSLVSAWFSPFRVFLPLIALFLSPFALAEEESEQSDESDGQIIVYGENDQIKEAGSAHQVSEETLELFEWDDIEKIVQTVPGVSTRGEDGFGLRPNIGIRGANSERSAKITLMEDGILLSPAPYAAPAAYYFPLSTRLTGVEIFKGASSTRYGPQTVGGALNVLTREIPEVPVIRTDVSAGLRNSYKAHVFVGSKGVLLEGVHLQTDGFKELPSGADTGFNRSEMMLKIARASKRQKIQIKLGISNEESQETYLGLTQSDWESNPWQRYAASELGLMSWIRTQAHVEWGLVTDRSWRWRTVAYHHYLDRSWRKWNGFQGGIDPHQLLLQNPQAGQGAVYLSILRGQENSNTAEQNLLIGTNDRQFQNVGLQTVGKKENWGEHWSNTLELGARVHIDQVERLHTEQAYAMVEGSLNKTDDTLITNLDAESQASAFSSYFYDDFQLGNWHLYPSARLELVKSFEMKNDETSETVLRETILPGFGILFDFSDWTHVFASSHKGFSPVAPGQPEEVQPELSWNYELGFRSQQDFAAFELIGFFNDYRNITGQCTFSSGCNTADIGSQYNGGEASIYGIESVAGYNFLLPQDWEVPLRVTYAYTQANFKSTFVSSFPQFGSVYYDDLLPYVAKHQANLSLGITATKWKISSNWQYRSRMLDQAGKIEQDGAEIEPLWMWDMAGERRIRKDFLVSISGNNLLNHSTIVSWRPYGARPVAPRQIFAQLRYER